MSEPGPSKEPAKPSLEETVQALADQVEILVGQLAKKDAEIDRLRGEVERLLKKLYRSTSEKLDPNQLLLILEGAESTPPSTPPSTPEPPADIPTQPAKPPRKRSPHGRSPLPEHLPREVVRHDLAGDQRLCPCCGEAMAEIGHDTCEQLDIVPAKLRVIRHEKTKYACADAACKREPEATVHTAERPAEPVPRCKATPAMLAAIIVDKFSEHTPLYRLQDQFARQDVHLARSTMCGWLTGCADALRLLHEAMLREVLASGYVHHDDTKVKRLQPGKGHCATSCFWVAVGTGPAPYCWFDFTLDRSTKERDGPLSIFELFDGWLHVDAYGGYDKLFRDTCEGVASKIIELACWAHTRRYFIGALESAAAGASWMLAKVQALYRVEKAARGLDPVERLALRREQALPLLADIDDWRKNQSALPKSPMGQALTYLDNQWDALNVYATAGHLEIDNNPAERALRPIAVGRKNWLFVGPGTRGGKTAAVLYSFTASCRKLNIDPFAYLSDVLARIMDHSSIRIDELLPIPWIEAHPEARYIPAHAARRR